MEPSRSGHLPINGLSLYYEVHGELGPSNPLPVAARPGCVHGHQLHEFVGVHVRGDTQRDRLRSARARPHPGDHARKMSYEQFADDAAALFYALQVGHTDVMGYSQGGGVALQLALRHPTLVTKLVSLSATYRQDGWYQSVLEGIKGAERGRRLPVPPYEQAFKDHTADASGVRRLRREDEGLEHRRPAHQPTRRCASISAPTMVVIGDADEREAGACGGDVRAKRWRRRRSGRVRSVLQRSSGYTLGDPAGDVARRHLRARQPSWRRCDRVPRRCCARDAGALLGSSTHTAWHRGLIGIAHGGWTCR